MVSNDGGSAFPNHDRMESSTGTTANFLGQSGMTMRDYFAAAALHGIIFHSGVWSDPVDEGCQQLRARNASTAYAYADAMIAERSRTDAAQPSQ